jgi:hypothetical protein
VRPARSARKRRGEHTDEHDAPHQLFAPHSIAARSLRLSYIHLRASTVCRIPIERPVAGIFPASVVLS